jgi:hypothetical protein
MPQKISESFEALGRMKYWPIALLTFPVMAQIDLSAVRKLDEQLPNYNEYKQTDEELEFHRQNRQWRPPVRKVPLTSILNSGTQYVAVPKGGRLRNLSENKNYVVHKTFYVKTFNLEDEHGFKYIQNKDGSAQWKVLSRLVEPISEEVSLYEPPLKYTPAPLNIVRSEYDKKLTVPPEISVYTGLVQGNYMRDLFNDKKALSGISNQYGIHAFTQWKIPIKAGAVFHYERTSYLLTGGGQVLYSAPSFGPQFKTREYEILGHPLRFQTQFRVGPFAKAKVKTTNGHANIKFNSADLLVSIERPIENRFGQFVLGCYGQLQWLSLKDQPEGIRLGATNETNRSLGISLAQVFE